jgi:hypothetical protein
VTNSDGEASYAAQSTNSSPELTRRKRPRPARIDSDTEEDGDELGWQSPPHSETEQK